MSIDNFNFDIDEIEKLEKELEAENDNWEIEREKFSWRQNLKKRKRRQKILRIVALFCALVAGATWYVIRLKSQPKVFLEGTLINSVDCSGLSLDEAEEKINSELGEHIVSLKFPERDFDYLLKGSMFDVKVSDKKDLSDILKHHDENSSYSLTVEVDESKLKDFLSSQVPDWTKVIEPENAYLKLGNDGLLTIVPEVIGYGVDDKAYNLILSAIQNLEEDEVELSSLTKKVPLITSDSLVLQGNMNHINSILKSKITYTFSDESTITLDGSILKDWLIQKDGLWDIDIDNNIDAFMSNIIEKAGTVDSTVEFNATNLGAITLPSPVSTGLDVEAELKRINDILSSDSQQEVELTPIYEAPDDFMKLETYVECDLTRQNVWLYVNGECILDTPCVSGGVPNNETPPGIFHLTYKTLNATLRGRNADGSRYATPVSYWMPFNGNIGFHDASWRNQKTGFGGQIYTYDGSHGCVNLPIESAKLLYQYIDYDMWIILYKS